MVETRHLYSSQISVVDDNITEVLKEILLKNSWSPRLWRSKWGTFSSEIFLIEYNITDTEGNLTKKIYVVVLSILILHYNMYYFAL